jgi:peptide/nickel transport system permease protein
MGRYIIQRVLAAIPVLLVVSAVAFMLQAFSPGDPARLLVEASGLSPAPPEAVAAKRAELRLDDPVLVRYANWLGAALRADFGRSYRSYEPVVSLYLQRFPATLALAGVAGVFSTAVALPLGILAAYHRGRWLDRIARVVAVIGAAVPGFWIALVLMYIFGARLGWLPIFGTLSLRGIILPAFVVALPNIAILTRLTRTATLDVLGQDYVTVARMKGMTETAIARRHVFPNVLSAVLTVFGLQLAGLLTGAAVVEYVFAWPGIGKLAVDAALLRDMPVVVGFAVAAGLIFVIVNLLTDIAVSLLDPRIRSV